jgi:hypothetical protein
MVYRVAERIFVVTGKKEGRRPLVHSLLALQLLRITILTLCCFVCSSKWRTRSVFLPVFFLHSPAFADLFPFAASSNTNVQHCQVSRLVPYRRSLTFLPASLFLPSSLSSSSVPPFLACPTHTRPFSLTGLEALIHQAAAQQRYWLIQSPITRIEGLTEEKLAEAVAVAAAKVRSEAGVPAVV